MRVAVERNGTTDRQHRSDHAFEQVLGGQVKLHRRADGKPRAAGSAAFVSAAHSGDLTLAATSDLRLGCDVETVTDRSAGAWQDLIGEKGAVLARRVRDEANEAEATSATRVWTARECLTKAGLDSNDPLTLDSVPGNGWVLLSAGPFIVTTVALSVSGLSNPVLFALLLEAPHASV